jgi:dTDP-glucose pyrophosphorylase
MTETKALWKRAILSPKATLQEAVKHLNEVAIKISLIVNSNGVLEGTISDGDIRRALLRGITLSSPITDVLRRNPLVVMEGMSHNQVLELMKINKIQQIPVVDDSNCLIGLHLWDDITTPAQRTNLIVIMAGGMGTRLLPHTEDCPKPMLKVAGRPMMEHIIERAKKEGFSHFVLAIHHLGHMIEDYFGDGSHMGVRIDYLKEETPLGTAGALSLLTSRPELPFVVTNGDLITDIRYGELLDFHQRYQASATMAVRVHEWQHPYGVVKMKGVEIVGFEEKPVARSHINAGVYVLNPIALDHLHTGNHCDMPTLFKKLQDSKNHTVAFPIHEPWLDVGRPDDLSRANGQLE